LLGAVYVLASLAVVLFVLPMLWVDTVGKPEVSDFVRWVHSGIQIAVLASLLLFGSWIAGESSPVGVRGGSLLLAVTLIVTFLIARIFAINIEGGIGQMVAAVVGVSLLYLAFRFFTGRTGEGWMVGLEEQGWFSAAQYKRSLGLRVRRLTILGVLIIGCTGAWSLWNQGVLPDRWILTIPFFDLGAVPLINEAKFFVPLLIACSTLWVAWRAVNVPSFAEFLIATEAEMNKVSWTPKKRLAQDTVVVLTTLLIMTLFLLVVDVFWGWLLSREVIGVLPARSTAQEKGPAQQAKW
jgi:preprotein translocase SecE subunit